MVRYGITRRTVPNDFPPWAAVRQQSKRWLTAGCFEKLAQDLRASSRATAGRSEEPTGAIVDSRTLRSTSQSGTHAGPNDARRKRGSKVHMAVDTVGHLFAVHVTPAAVSHRSAVKRPAADIRDATGQAFRLGDVDQGCTGEAAADADAAEVIAFQVAELSEAERGSVPLPRRWIMARSFARAPRSRRLVKGCERCATTPEGFHMIASAGYMLSHEAVPMRNA